MFKIIFRTKVARLSLCVCLSIVTFCTDWLTSSRLMIGYCLKCPIRSWNVSCFVLKLQLRLQNFSHCLNFFTIKHVCLPQQNWNYPSTYCSNESGYCWSRKAIWQCKIEWTMSFRHLLDEPCKTTSQRNNTGNEP